ncbi:MAG: undecaprenyl-phosphate glucose phosphotransferase [Flavobacteriales bacterium]|nr:undecaprenyl-phosphate glucose phosphotransferase [Flavobacteriales bacterium]
MIRPHHSKLVFVFRLIDSTLIFMSLYMAMQIYGIGISEQYFLLGIISVASFSVFSEGLRVYSSLRGASLREIAIPVVINWSLVVFACLGLAYFTKVSSDFSRVVVGIWLLLTPVVLVTFRILSKLALSHIRKNGYNSRTVAIVGAEEQGNRLASYIEQTPSLGLKLLGFFDNRREDKRTPPNLVKPIIGNFNDAIERAKSGEIDLIYLAISLKGQERSIEIIDKLKDTTVSVHLVPDFFVYDLLHSRWANIGSIPTISVFESPFMSVHGWLKRVEDIVLSSLILVLIALPMMAIAIGIKLTSPGPVIFKQRRYGLDGKAIRIWKFRSMTTSDDGDTVVQAKKNDTRVTKFGAFLRRTSLDELPQFINVLRGEMSIVGPRPHAVAHNEEYRKLISGYMLRHKVPPGITGWAQINGWRGETDTLEKMEKRIEYDLWYIRSWSLFLDIKIIAKTIFKGFKSQNAY